MTYEEWRPLAYLLMTGWAGKFTKDNATGYFVFLNEYTVREVEYAIKRLSTRGGTWTPSAAQIVAEIEKEKEALVPSFDEVWANLVRRAMFHAEPVEWLQAQGAHPYLIAWLASYGIKRMKMEPVDDPRVGGAVVNRIRVSFDEFVERARERERQGRPILNEATERVIKQIGPRPLREVIGELPKGAA